MSSFITNGIRYQPKTTFIFAKKLHFYPASKRSIYVQFFVREVHKLVFTPTMILFSKNKEEWFVS